MKQWNVSLVVTPKRINIAQCPTVVNAISAPTFSKGLLKVSIPFSYYRHTRPQQIDQVLQAHSEGTGFQGISRINGLAYNTVVRIIRFFSSRALLVHNDHVGWTLRK
ncbi:hypothetical protein [Leptothermofonsia sp. ETS-13]|uniref:hypothetical protein n=1 Tax=Leptothermofonsia sp. ETS-13 TaxID=3035696 RepID=UPI003BA0FF41